MSEHSEESIGETMIEKINEANHHKQQKEEDSSSSSSDSESDKPSFSSKANRLFGREKPVHTVLGGGKPADVLLWRDKKMSASILVGVTVIWLLFEWLGYHLLTLICHSLILSLAILFLWSNASTFIHKSPPKIPEVILPQDLFVNIALSLRFEINRAFVVLREVASGRDLKKFLMMIAGLWILSVVGSWCNFLTLFYIAFVTLHTVPVLYEKHEDHVDAFAEKATVEIKKQYAVLDAKVLQKLPRAGTFKDKKHQ